MVIHGSLQKPTILITGASGVIGSSLLEQFPMNRVVALTHRHQLKHEGHSVRGDITDRYLGLSSELYRELVLQIDTIIHCAAITDFSVSKSEVDRVNINGVTNILNFATQANAKLYYVSSAFVDRATITRTAQGKDLFLARATPDAYLASKKQAENIIRDAAVDATIIRPSLTIGNMHDGVVPQFQGLSFLAELVIRGMLPVIPATEDTLIDFIPRDVVALCIKNIVNSPSVLPEYSLTAGNLAPRAREVFQIVVDEAQNQGIDVTLPDLVDTERIDRLIRPVYMSVLSRPLLQVFDDALSLSSLFDNNSVFPSDVSSITDGSVDLSLSLLWWRNSIRYLLSRKKIASRVSALRTLPVTR